MMLVNLSELPWAELPRNAAIFRELLRIGSPFDQGIFVAPVAVLGRATSINQRWRALGDDLRLSEVISDGVALHTYAPRMMLPRSANRAIERIQVELFRRVLDRRIGGKPYCLWLNCVERPTFALAKHLAPRAARVVIDLSDDWTTFDDRDPAGRDVRLKESIEMADALLAVNSYVLAKFPHPRGRVFANATDFDNFQRHDEKYVLGDVLPKRPGQKLVGFSGGLHVGRIDEELLDRLIAAVPDATFVFVGYSNSPTLLARLRASPNVRVFPWVSFRELPSVIRAFDVAIVPHAINELTRGNDLLKVLDYMASGVPIVATDCSNVRKYGSAVKVAENHDQFIAMVRAVLEGAPHDPSVGLNLAREATWARRVPELARWLTEVLGCT